MKEFYIKAHEELIEKYLERHPNATWDEAYEITADFAYDKMIDDLEDMSDRLKDM